MDIGTVLHGYMVAALWASTDSEGEPLDSNYHLTDIAPETASKMRQDVQAFLDRIQTTSLSPEQVGHDFWLTRNHHGTGFWDRGLGAEGERLTQIAQSFPEVDLYVDDNFQISA